MKDKGRNADQITPTALSANTLFGVLDDLFGTICLNVLIIVGCYSIEAHLQGFFLRLSEDSWITEEGRCPDNIEREFLFLLSKIFK